MKPFTFLFDLALLPVKTAVDVVLILPDLSSGQAPFSKTREHCEQLDEDLRG